MCSDLCKLLKNKQLNLIANYYKFDFENSVNKSLFIKNFSGVAPGSPSPEGEGDPLSHLPQFRRYAPHWNLRCHLSAYT